MQIPTTSQTLSKSNRTQIVTRSQTHQASSFSENKNNSSHDPFNLQELDRAARTELGIQSSLPPDLKIRNCFLRTCQETAPNIDPDSILGKNFRIYFMDTVQKYYAECLEVINHNRRLNSMYSRLDAQGTIEEAMLIPDRKLTYSAIPFFRENRHIIIVNVTNLLLELLIDPSLPATPAEQKSSSRTLDIDGKLPVNEAETLREFDTTVPLEESINDNFLALCNVTNLEPGSNLAEGVRDYFSYTAKKIHTTCSAVINAGNYSNENEKRLAAFKLIDNSLRRPLRKLKESGCQYFETSAFQITLHIRAVLVETLI